MKFVLLPFIVIIMLFVTSIAFSAEPVPIDDFVKITEQALDSLDEIETVFSASDSTKIEAKQAFKKFDITMKKFDRYIKSWPECTQGEIAWSLINARLSYNLTLIEGTSGKAHNEAKLATQEARDIFMKYKMESTKKNRK